MGSRGVLEDSLVVLRAASTILATSSGTVNPGIVWAGTYAQLAVEAVIPINNRSGNRVGWLAQFHFFLDDLFPGTIGRPLARK